VSEFEDPQLRDRLGRESGAFPDDNAAYAVVVAKVGRARRRRAVVVSTTTTVVLIIAFLLGAGMRGRDAPRTLSPVDTSLPERDLGSTTSAVLAVTSVASTTTTASTTTSLASSSTSSSTTTVVATTSNSSAVPNGTVAPDSTLPAETVETATPADPGAPATTNKKRTSPTTVAPRRSTPGRGTAGPTTIAAPPTDPPDVSPVPTPATDPRSVTQPLANDPPARFETFSGIGGTVTVRLEHDTMQVVDKVPSAGFDIGGNPDLSGDHVEVRFFSGSHYTRVRVELVGGVMVPDVEERGSSDGSSGSQTNGGQIEHAPSTDGEPSGGGSRHGGPDGPG